MRLVHVLVAPGTLGPLPPAQAASVVVDAWHAAAAHDDVVAAPLSDGGPGFVDALRASLGGELLAVTTTSPTGAPAPGTVLLAPDGRTAYVESAHAVARTLLAAGHDVGRGTSAGVGTLVRVAVEAGARRVVVGLGGGGTVDAGAGMLAALGLPDARGVLAGGGAALADVDEPDLRALPELRASLRGIELVGAYDAGTALLGLQGTSAGAASELGLSAERAQVLERSIARLARLAVDALGDAERPDLLGGARPVTRLTSAAGAGAGGGLGFGLSLLGGRLVPAPTLVADAVGLDALAATADLVVTGATCLDWRSVDESVVAEVARRSLAHGVPTVVVAGEVLVGRREQAAAGITAAYAVGTAGRGEGADQVADLLAARTRRVARTWSPDAS